VSPRRIRIGGRAGNIIALLIVAAIIAAVVVVFSTTQSGTKYSAIFDNVIGVYPESDVRVLGVKVGTVDSVQPEGTHVRVDFHVSGQKLPADAKALVVIPTVVADRYIQITPAYAGGPVLPPGTVIPNSRTGSPAEYDDLLAAAQKLSLSLGPKGVNKNGALSEALTTLSRNLNGNGQRLNTALDNASQAINTLSASRNDLAGTIRGLQSFTTNLKQNDPQVRAFTLQFAQVNHYLAGEREDLGRALHDLSEVLGEVASFVRDNRHEIRNNVDQLSDVLDTINANRLQLDQVLDVAQLPLDGLANAYNASSGTLDTRTQPLSTLLCTIFNQAPAVFASGEMQLARLVGAPDPTHPCTGIGSLPLPPGASLPQPVQDSLVAFMTQALPAPKAPVMTSSAPSVPSATSALSGSAPATPAHPSEHPDKSPPAEQHRPLTDLFGIGR
jgi:virulence factor Mce-like protein